jgi:heme/copper-type cytochrome/quinol oxidase subunit 2
MKRNEIIAALAAFAMLILMPGVILAYQYVYVPAQSPQNVNDVTIIMRAPENGNITPTVIHAKVGQLVRLHITSHDVAHAFWIGELGVDAGVIEPGKWTTIEFTPDEAGEFSYTCNVRCSPQHNLVRGKLIVEE